MKRAVQSKQMSERWGQVDERIASTLRVVFIVLKPGKRKRKQSAGSGASALVGGIATNKITIFLVEAEAEAALKS